jgi:hypothetical protein
VRHNLPELTGRPIHVEIRPSLGPHLAATFIPARRIFLDAEVLIRRGEFERILIHEIFHFAWVRLSNPRRRSWETLLAGEAERGELGWSAESRKSRLRASDRTKRTPAWRSYVCESFCDSAAWLWSGLKRHDEFTLPASARRARRNWLEREFSSHPVCI